MSCYNEDSSILGPILESLFWATNNMPGSGVHVSEYPRVVFDFCHQRKGLNIPELGVPNLARLSTQGQLTELYQAMDSR